MEFLTKLFSGGAGTLVKSVGEAIDKVVTSDEERMELENESRRAEMDHRREMRSLDIRETEAFLQDTASARDFQSSVQDSENAGWLAKNIQPFLAIMLVGLTFAIFAKVLFGKFNANTHESTIIMMILGSLVTIVTQIVSYFFGSSKGGDAQALKRALARHPPKRSK